jgi:hypothetical protein
MNGYLKSLRNLGATSILLKLRILTLRRRWLSWLKPSGSAKMVRRLPKKPLNCLGRISRNCKKTHDDDPSLIENLRKDHDKSSKAVEDLRHNNADLAKTLSSKEQKIQDFERALAEQREASGKHISEITNKLHLLFKEYEKSLMNFGVRPAPLPADISLADFMRWIEIEFKALPEVITGASDFVVDFSVESILKLLHDFDFADLVKFREKLPQFPDASSTSRLRPNKDVLAIKTKFAREFWFASGREIVKSVARAKLTQVVFLRNAADSCEFADFLFFNLSHMFSFDFFSCSKRRSGVRTLRHQNLLKMTKMKNRQTRTRKTLATAATTTVMAIIPPNMRKIPRKLTSRAKH